MDARSHIVIPARLNSTRLPHKLLLRETGKSLLQHTFESAQQAKRPTGICVATDHVEIQAEVRQFGGIAQMTDPSATSGTDRVAEVAAGMSDVDVIVNVQGDEPELSGEAIDLAIELLERDSEAVMSTLATPIRRREQLHDPACVKVVCDQQGRALYFSRSCIPFARDGDDTLLHHSTSPCLLHIGLYAYRREFLLKLAALPPSELEQLEKLEQLRVLSAGCKIAVGIISEATVGIDTPDDYRAFVQRHRQRTMAA